MGMECDIGDKEMNSLIDLESIDYEILTPLSKLLLYKEINIFVVPDIYFFHKHNKFISIFRVWIRSIYNIIKDEEVDRAANGLYCAALLKIFES